MWTKRSYAQLTKCTEAQALRRAFPELLGGQPTAEEMEGKIKWVSEEDKKPATKKAGVDGLKDILGFKEAASVNTDTGEIVDIEAIKQQIEQAKNNAELTDAAQKISAAGEAISKEEKDELKKLYAVKRDELKTLEVNL